MNPIPPMTVAPGEAPRWPHHLAAIDIGSNSFRLEIGEVAGGSYRRIDYLKQTVRLAPARRQRAADEEAARRGLACLASFAQRLAGYALPQVRAVATQTLREAGNGTHSWPAHRRCSVIRSR